MGNKARIIAALCTSLVLGGCEAVAMGVAAPMVIQQKHVNLLNSSYAAADILAQQTERRFARETPLVVSDLQEILDMNQKKIIANPKVGRVLSEQMRTRFIQLGYNVIDTDVYTGNAKKSGEVSGTYEIKNGTMTVALRLKDRNSGKILGLHDYTLPVTYDIKKYMSGNANMLPPLL